MQTAGCGIAAVFCAVVCIITILDLKDAQLLDALVVLNTKGRSRFKIAVIIRLTVEAAIGDGFMHASPRVGHTRIGSARYGIVTGLFPGTTQTVRTAYNLAGIFCGRAVISGRADLRTVRIGSGPTTTSRRIAYRVHAWLDWVWTTDGLIGTRPGVRIAKVRSAGISVSTFLVFSTSGKTTGAWHMKTAQGRLTGIIRAGILIIAAYSRV